MDWDMQEFTEELAMEWLKKPCWSIAESMLLLGEYQVPVSRRAGYPLPPEFAGNAGNGLDSLIRAIIAQQLKPIANVEGSIRGRFPLYSPADVISVAESIDFGNWKNWKNRLKRLQVTQIQTDTEMVNKIIETERLAEIAKEESYATTPQLWAYDMSIELAERNGGMNYAQRCVVEIQIMRTFEANTDTLPLRQTPTFLLWPKGHPLPPLWRDGLFLRKDELRVWAKEYCPDLLGSSLIAESVATSDAQPEAKEKAQKAGIIQEWQNKVEDMAAELINPCKKPQLICDLDLQCGIPAEEQQRVERRKLGRYTLQEAAALIAQEIGEPAALIEQKLMQGVKDAALIVYAPGSQVRYQSLTVRRFYEEAYWDGLNEWLNKKEPRIIFRFPQPEAVPMLAQTQPQPPKRARAGNPATRLIETEIIQMEGAGDTITVNTIMEKMRGNAKDTKDGVLTCEAGDGREYDITQTIVKGVLQRRRDKQRKHV